MKKKHGSVPKLHTCSGPESRNEQKPWHSKCHYKRNSGSPLRRYEQPHSMGVGLRSDRRPTSGSPLLALTTTTMTPAPDGRAATAQASGWALLKTCPRPHRRSRGEDKYEEPEARSEDGGGDPVGDGDFSSRLHLGTNDRGRQPSGRSPLRSSRTSGAPTSTRRSVLRSSGRIRVEICRWADGVRRRCEVVAAEKVLVADGITATIRAPGLRLFVLVLAPRA